MRSLSKNKWLTWLWLGAVLTATTGVSVHQIYCYCVGKTSISLWDKAEACAMPSHVNADCCQPKLSKKSCCAPKGGQDTCAAPKGKDCTRKTIKVFQLKTEFTIEQVDLQQLALFDYSSPQLPQFTLLLPAENRIGVCNNKAPPPPLSGRMIGIRLQTFRC